MRFIAQMCAMRIKEHPMIKSLVCAKNGITIQRTWSFHGYISTPHTPPKPRGMQDKACDVKIFFYINIGHMTAVYAAMHAVRSHFISIVQFEILTQTTVTNWGNSIGLTFFFIFFFI